MFVNKKKCNFRKTSVAYLGHIITFEGVVIDQKKIESVVQWLTHKIVKEVYGFLELISYYKKICERL